MSAPGQLIEWSWSGLPCLGNRLSGDLVLLAEHEGLPRALVVDVAGHGPRAHSVAQRIQSLRPLEHAEQDLPQTLQFVHQALRGGGRLAAAMAVRICQDEGQPTLEYCGVGNISLVGSAAALRSEGRPGMLGQVMPEVRVQRVPFADGASVAIHTDGLSSGLRLTPELDGMEVQEVAPELLRRYGRLHDDATCLVIRNRGRCV